MSFTFYLESLLFSSLLNKEVSGWLFESESDSVCCFLSISQLLSAMEKVNHPQCYDELFGDPILNVMGCQK